MTSPTPRPRGRAGRSGRSTPAAAPRAREPPGRWPAARTRTCWPRDRRPGWRPGGSGTGTCRASPRRGGQLCTRDVPVPEGGVRGGQCLVERHPRRARHRRRPRHGRQPADVFVGKGHVAERDSSTACWLDLSVSRHRHLWFRRDGDALPPVVLRGTVFDQHPGQGARPTYRVIDPRAARTGPWPRARPTPGARRDGAWTRDVDRSRVPVSATPPSRSSARSARMPGLCRDPGPGATGRPQATRTGTRGRRPARGELGAAAPCTSEWLLLADLDDQLAEVAAGEQAAERLGSVLQPVDDVLAVAHRPVGHPAGHVAHEVAAVRLGNSPWMKPRTVRLLRSTRPMNPGSRSGPSGAEVAL